MIKEILDKSLVDYVERVGESVKLIWLCKKHSVELESELSKPEYRRYSIGLAIDTRLNGEIRCLVCGTGLYVESSNE